VASISEIDPVTPLAAGKASIPTASWYALAIFLCVNILNFVDRKLPFILIEPIRADLKLNDAQMGLLGGVMFTLVYAVAGLPLGRLADRWPRKPMLGAAVALWGITTTIGGLATNFAQFAASRIGLAVGEAVINPTATSMIADLFPPNRRRFALSVFLLGSTLGVMLGLTIGGLLVDRLNWRHVMFLFAIPSGVLALLIIFTLREPTRDAPDGATDAPTLPLWPSICQLLSKPAMVHIALAACLYIFATSSLYAFAPAFAIRTFALSAGQAGTLVGVIMGGAGALGTLAGGLIVDRLGTRDVRWNLRVPALSLLLAAPLFLAAWSAPSAALSMTLLAPAAFFVCMYLGPTYAAVQELAGPRMRGLAVSVLTFAMYAVGGSLGPVVTGIVSDSFKRAGTEHPLGKALAVVTVALVWSALHFWLAAKRLGSSEPDKAPLEPAQAKN
jgi:predicted MFS family arabinose efflux permease